MPLASGVYTLIGVFAGGFVTGGVQWGMARRDDWLDTRLARRLVREELQSIYEAAAHLRYDTEAQTTLSEDEERSERRRRLATAMPSLLKNEMYQAHRQQLARHLTDDDWKWLVRAYDYPARLALESPGDGDELVDKVTHAASVARNRLDEPETFVDRMRQRRYRLADWLRRRWSRLRKRNPRG